MSKPTVYIYHSLRRTGNHALANWIIANHIGSEDFVLRNSDPYIRDNFEYYNNTNWLNMRKMELDVDKNYFLGIENRVQTSIVKLRKFSRKHKSHNVKYIIGVRSYHNHYSSVINGDKSRIYVTGDIFRKWEVIRKKMRKESKRLHKTNVLFDSWFESKEYRMELADRLGLPKDDLGLERVAYNGKASSFDGQKYDGRAQEMKVTERWKHIDWNEPKHKEILKKLIPIQLEDFGHVPEELLKIAEYK